MASNILASIQDASEMLNSMGMELGEVRIPKSSKASFEEELSATNEFDIKRRWFEYTVFGKKFKIKWV